MKIAKLTLPRPPSHLSKRSAAFWTALNEQYVFEPADLERLRAVCESMGTVDLAEKSIHDHGLIVVDRYGAPKPNAATTIARDARAAVLRGLRELNIDVELPSESRLPRQGRRYG